MSCIFKSFALFEIVDWVHRIIHYSLVVLNDECQIGQGPQLFLRLIHEEALPLSIVLISVGLLLKEPGELISYTFAILAHILLCCSDSGRNDRE